MSKIGKEFLALTNDDMGEPTMVTDDEFQAALDAITEGGEHDGL